MWVMAGATGHSPFPKARWGGGRWPLSPLEGKALEISQLGSGGKGESSGIICIVLLADQLRSKSQLHVLK